MGGPQASRKTVLFWVLFVALAVGQCAPFWGLSYFPSQDGPSHLYNSVVLADYTTVPLYQDFYQLQLRWAGNLFTSGLMWLLMLVFQPHLAERFLLTLYALLLPLSVYWVITGNSGGSSEQGKEFSLLGFLFVPNFFLHMGFWNFCYSVPLALLAYGYFFRKDAAKAWPAGSMVLFAVMSLGVYSAHIVAWGVLVGAVLCTAISRFLNGNTVRASIGSVRLPLFALLPTAIPAGLYVVTALGHSAASPEVEPLAPRIWPVYSFSFLRTLYGGDRISAAFTGGLLLVLAVAALWSRRKALWGAITDSRILLAGLLVCGSMIVPDVLGQGAYIRSRMLLFAFLFVAFWCAAQLVQGFAGQPWTGWIARGSVAAAVILCFTALLFRMSVYRQWDRALEEFVQVGELVAPGSTLLAVRTNDDGLTRIRPLLHAAGLLAPEVLINLGNYEAGTDHFLTTFRPQMSPFPELVDLGEAEQIPMPINVERYEQNSGRMVDYLLFYTSPQVSTEGIEPAPGRDYREEQVYADQLKGFVLAHESQKTIRLRLWRRADSAVR